MSLSELETDAEELFPPRPGGKVDTARKSAAATLANSGTTTAPATPRLSIRVRPEAADTGTVRTVTLGVNNQVLRIVGRDSLRRSAHIIAVDNPVYLSGNLGVAQDAAAGEVTEGVGYIPVGMVVPVPSQAEMYIAATTTATPSRVTVIVAQDSA